MLQAQTETFFYAQNGKQILFEKNNNIRYVHFVSDIDTTTKETALAAIEMVSLSVEKIGANIYRCNLSESQISNFDDVISDLTAVTSYSNEYRLPNSKILR